MRLLIDENKLKKWKTKTEKFEKSLKLLYIVNFKTIRSKLTAAGKFN